MRRMIVAGSRSFCDQRVVNNTIERALLAFPLGLITEVISGCAVGVDTCGEIWADRQGIPVTLGGMIRNEKMAKYAAETTNSLLVAVLAPGKSNGTRHMIKMGMKYGLTIFVNQIGKGTWMFIPESMKTRLDSDSEPKILKRRIEI